MQVVILGSDSPLPDPNRAGPSTLIRTTAGDLLFDCGRGILMRAAAVGSAPGAFRALFLTHLHSDLEPDIGYRLAHHDDLNWRPGPCF
jgi:ribonuclease Z